MPGASSHQVSAQSRAEAPNASCIHRVALAARDTIVRGFALPAAPGALGETPGRAGKGTSVQSFSENAEGWPSG
ncbi:hypothetical protein MPC4_170103 [Methylocella tundrae]|uniref:Uncharacterized protein n=1 Tax=Methylocella tundrae TaxID=227605 RepID=A0A8B6M648_METTU|nr:hypothetical protein MPC1_2740007 [Methylocella tundrae]VTZ49572.1 hypothetical protein MPC4_170103 [Methylocella tundrae]